VIVIAAGRLAWRGTPEELIARAGALAVVTFRLPAGVTTADQPDLDGAVDADGAFVEVVGQDPLRLLHTLTAWAPRRGTGLRGAVERRSPEEAYLGVLGEEMTDGG
jgi:hypothetical protein